MPRQPDPELAQVVLYGSPARGEAHPDSDVDVLVVVKGDVKPETQALLRKATDNTPTQVEQALHWAGEFLVAAQSFLT